MPVPDDAMSENESNPDESGDDGTEKDHPETVQAVIDWLRDQQGQAFYTTGYVYDHVANAYPLFLPDDVEEDDADGDQLWEAVRDLQEGLAEQTFLAMEERDTHQVDPWDPLISAQDVSALFVEAIDREPSTATMGGRGFTADKRHDDNVAILQEHLDSQTPDDEGDTDD